MHRFKYLLLSSVLCLAPPLAHAAQTNSAANATAGSHSTSGASAATGASSSGASLSITSNTTDSGNTPSTETIHNNTQAPDVVVSGANSCALPLGGSTSVLGFGFGVVATPTDKGCERRADAQAWYAMGKTNVAEALLCESKEDADAVAAAGESCPGTKTAANSGPTATAAVVPGPVAMLTPVPAVQPVIPVPVVPVVAREKPKQLVLDSVRDNTDALNDASYHVVSASQ